MRIAKPVNAAWDAIDGVGCMTVLFGLLTAAVIGVAVASPYPLVVAAFSSGVAVLAFLAGLTVRDRRRARAETKAAELHQVVDMTMQRSAAETIAFEEIGPDDVTCWIPTITGKAAPRD